MTMVSVQGDPCATTLEWPGWNGEERLVVSQRLVSMGQGEGLETRRASATAASRVGVKQLWPGEIQELGKASRQWRAISPGQLCPQERAWACVCTGLSQLPSACCFPSVRYWLGRTLAQHSGACCSTSQQAGKAPARAQGTGLKRLQEPGLSPSDLPADPAVLPGA